VAKPELDIFETTTVDLETGDTVESSRGEVIATTGTPSSET
jgi:hypothetical protein